MSGRGSEWRRWDLHLHTRSSYDYKYNADDADEILIRALIENEIQAVAITDHFVIDSKHIKKLRALAPNIVFFPGVELRTDKGDTNIHVILIFSDKIDLKILEEDFNVFKRQKSVNSNDNYKIYWDFGDIVAFADEHNALISIHAGSKSSGVDDRITNALPINQAIKEEYARHIDFFEMGKLKDLSDYRKHVFSSVDEKPMIICSDNHDPREYKLQESLWIKANLSFDGLKQCLHQPEERVFVGTIPPALDRLVKNGKLNISNIKIERIEKPKNNDVSWFDANIDLNAGLVAIIGNKGSGKSAISDIIGHLCKCTTMDKASFLTASRFRKLPKNYADDYESIICWSDGHVEKKRLSETDYQTTIEDAQYLPQKFIEEVCNDIGNEFQIEIDKVIFSYVDQTEKGNAKNLHELIENKAKTVYLVIEKIRNEIRTVNKSIIDIEFRMTTSYLTNIKDNLKKLEENLARHEAAKPIEIKRPEKENVDNKYQEELQSVNAEIDIIKAQISEKKEILTRLNAKINDLSQLITRIELLGKDVIEVNRLVTKFIGDYDIKGINEISFATPEKDLKDILRTLVEERNSVIVQVGKEDEAKSLSHNLRQLERKKEKIIEGADIQEKKYQKYLLDIAEWEKERKLIIGDDITENTIIYLRKELKYITSQIVLDYSKLKEQREVCIERVIRAKQDIVNIYKEIYTPIELEIEKILGHLEEGISFGAEIQLVDNDIADKLLAQINQKYAGVFKGKTESSYKMTQLIRQTEFDKPESLIQFIRNVLQVVDEDLDVSDKKVINKQDFYDLLCGLDYIGVAYKLKMGGRDLDELSPGERGIVLLVFYLALSKNSIPIIIDQPEDNLDNQSVFNKLVPCICEAKKKRQVIIVTHNPNIAIACDAEQIICCHMDKATHTIKYTSGAIEEENIKKCVVDILEGTFPAFDLRKKKYINE